MGIKKDLKLICNNFYNCKNGDFLIFGFCMLCVQFYAKYERTIHFLNIFIII